MNKTNNKPAQFPRQRRSTSNREYKLPLVLECQVTGKTVKYSNPKYIDRKIDEAGSLARLQHTFVSREGKAVLKRQGERQHRRAA